MRGLTAAASALSFAVGALASAPAPTAARQAEDACNIVTTSRVVAVGDVHGAFDQFVRLLREAGLVNASNRWAGGSAHLVQLGDVLDRGTESRRVLDLLMRLEREAERAGGRVHALLGNHEVMRMMGDLRYVSAGEYQRFRGVEAEELRERYYELARERAEDRARRAGTRFDERAYRSQFQKDVPLGFVEMQVAFAADGEYGRWLRQRLAMVRINGVLFVHGGIGPRVASLGCSGVNAGVRREMANFPAVDDPKSFETLVAGPDGPLWFRGLVDDAAPMESADVLALLDAFGARAVVVGHTVAPDATVRVRHGQRVFQIDTGMLGGSFYPGGQPSALDITEGRFTLIQLGRRTPLSAPSTSTGQ